MTEETLSARLVELCKLVGVRAARITGERDKQRSLVDTLGTQAAHAERDAELARRAASDRAADVSALVTSLANDERYGWVRRAMPAVSELPAKAPSEVAEVLDSLTQQLETARNKARASYSMVQGLDAAFGTIGRQLRQGQGMSGIRSDSEPRWDQYARGWLASEVRGWFADDVIRSSIFEEGSSGVTLDASSLTVSWRSPDGSSQEKPLAAFSSGQQAFAYTQARIANLDRDYRTTPNRLIALDEFGAFIDSDRMEALGGTLTHRVSADSGDQYLVILPLERSTAALESDPAAQSLLESLRRRGYFYEEFRA
jgi:hypothetical protein